MSSDLRAIANGFSGAGVFSISASGPYGHSARASAAPGWLPVAWLGSRITRQIASIQFNEGIA